MTADFNYFLNTQGLRGRKGEKGDTGFAPTIVVGQNTANTFTLRITTVDGTFETPNLRGSIISGTGSGVFLSYDPSTDTIYLRDLPTASTTTEGITRLATSEEITAGSGEGAVTASDLADFTRQNLFDYLSAGNGIELSANGVTGVVSIGILTGFVASKITATNSNGIKLTKDNSTGVTDIDIDATGLQNNFTDSPVGTNRIMLSNDKIYIQDNEQQIVFRGLNNGGTDGDIVPRKTSYYVGLDVKKSFVPNSLTAGSNVSLTKDTSAGTVEINATVPTKTSDLTNDSGFITSSDLPTVGNGTITLTQGGSTKGTFTVNQSGNTTIDLDAGGASDVTSVNGQTGDVVLSATDVGALPDSTVIPTVNDATITFTQGGVTKGTITTNQGTSATIALDAGSSGTITDVQVNNVSVVDTTTGIANIIGLASDNAVVHLANNETISGQKTFSAQINANAGVKTNQIVDMLNDMPLLYTDNSLSKTGFGGYTNDLIIYSKALRPTYTQMTSGSTSVSTDLALTSDLPTVNDATLTIQKNGTNVGTFSANASTASTINISVPVDTGDLTNNAGFITGISSSDVTTALGYTPYNSANPSGYQENVIETISVNNTALVPSSKAVNITVPTDTSDLTNGAGFITSVPTATANTLGAVQPDGTTITIDQNGVISSSGGSGGSIAVYYE